VFGSFSYALSGIELGFVAGPKQIIDWLKQNSKPYVYCASPAPALLGAAKESLKIAAKMKLERSTLEHNSADLRGRLKRAGFTVVASPHPITAVITGDAVKTQHLTNALFEDSIFALGLCYPVVPKGVARVRIQLNIGHSERDIGQIVNAFTSHGKTLKILGN
jgi:glycine C-acetyltransferase